MEQPDLARVNALVQGMLTRGELRPTRTQVDTMLPGREHERLQQVWNGVPVFGGEAVVQRDGRDIRSINGILYGVRDVNVRPTLTAADALAKGVAALGTSSHADRDEPTLVVLPLEDKSFALCYTFHRRTPGDRVALFIDAHTGEVRLRYSDLWRQSAVGRATGVWNDVKKLSASQTGSTYWADDYLRPPEVITLDMKGLGYLMYFFSGMWKDSDIAADADNNWTDGAVVDAHVYAGLVYDYYYKRFGRRGLDNANAPLISVVHNIFRNNPDLRDPDVSGLFANNAFWDGEWMWYGEGDGITETYNSAGLDIVAHELTHGVTQYTSGLIYRGESGALNESFSDIMGTAAEFFHEPAGNGRKQAEWLLGEDATMDFARMLADPSYDRPVRSLADPGSRFQPDHYTRRYTGTADNGGVHRNSGISNNAFYLFVQGGTNRTSGMSVQGLGISNIERAEKIFYRAFVFYLPRSATFGDARAATLQAARELYGAGSNEERQLAAAWTAVGVN